VITAIQGIVHCRQAVEENIDQNEIRMEWYKQHRSEAKADPVLLAWAREELSEGACGPAAKACGDLVKTDSSHSSSQDLLLVHAQCLSHAGKYHQSDLELKRVIDIDRKTERALDALLLCARMAYESQERRYAIELYSSALRDLRYPARRSELHYLRGLAYEGIRCIDSAQMDFRQALSSGGDEQFRVLAEIELSKEDAASDQSSAGLNRLIEIGKSRRDRAGSSAAVAAMRILVDRQRVDEAMKLGEFIDKTYREFPECMRLTYMLWGRAFELADHLSKAKQMYQRIIQDYPGSREAIEAQSRLEEL
jgi:tetratricopeptide (TPR) repeat protein